MVHCSILGCSSHSGRKTGNITFHRFPKETNLREQWVRATGRHDWHPSKEARLCSIHFEDKCFRRTEKLTLLLQGSVPNISVQIMFDVKACRGCLNTECKLEKISDAFRRIFPSLSGLEITENDGYPQYFCVECHAQVKRALAFRRKCRRAGFVLKQIMNTKKQVCYSDIVAVNRTKTNLVSSLTYKPSKLYINILPQEVEEQRRLEEERLEEQRRLEEEICLQEIADDIDRDDGLEDNEEIQNIDLDDVFKDLKEDDNEEESEEEVEREIVKIEKEAPKEEKKIVKRKMYTNLAHRALTRSEIKYVPEEKQVSNFHMRLRDDPFKSALFKCSICVLVVDTLELLMEHVKQHVAIPNGSSCRICKWMFKNDKELIVHQAENHWYEYLCGWCDKTHYTLDEQRACYRTSRGASNKKRKIDYYLSFFNKIPLAQEDMPSSLVGTGSLHKCPICNMGFGTLKYFFDAHLMLHTKIKFKCVCDVCGAKFLSTKMMRTHLERYHMYSYSCKRCNQLVTNCCQAKEHILQECTKSDAWKVPNVSRPTCSVCHRTYKTTKKLLEHLTSSYHSQLYTHHCNMCGDSFKSQAYLLRHQFNDHKYMRVNDPALCSEDFFCSECGVWFVSKRALDTHVVKRGHDAAQHVDMACLPCKLVFDSQEEYVTHAASCCHTIYPHKCVFCSMVLQTASGSLQHYRHKHKEYPPLQALVKPKDTAICEQCGKEISPRGRLKRHMEAHKRADEAKVSLKCDLCKTTTYYTSLSGLVNHLVNAHTSRPYCCALCPGRYRYRYECRDHILKVHAPERPYTCGECSRTFAHQDFLNDHALKAHNVNLKKLNRDLFMSRKMKGKLAVFPNMKIDVSRIDRELLKEVDIYWTDYLDEKVEILKDFSDYVILEPNKESEPRRKRRKTKEELIEEIPMDEDVKDIKLDDVQETTKVFDELGREHEVIEEDGVQHVLIDGVLYKLETE